ncbi:MAG: NAD(P) transhydrogenase subunit alpha [Candidatus Sericytochromatia bacterium]
MIVGVPSENQAIERRVPLLPAEVKKLAALGLKVQVEAGLAAPLAIPDSDYTSAGAEVRACKSALLAEADILLRLNVPCPEELSQVSPRALHISYLAPFQSQELLQICLKKHISALSMELIPRITRCQAMDALTSQASLAGYVAVLLAAQYLPRVFPMMSTPAGTLQAARVLVIGAGVAGLQAIATARRLGARVEACDLRPEATEQIQSLGARALKLNLVPSQANAEGYLTQISEGQLQQQQQGLAEVLGHMDVVITTAQVFGKKAPLILTDSLLDALKPGSVVVDGAVDSGGNVAGIQANQVIVRQGVTLVGFRNLPGRVPRDASQMYSANLYYLLKELWDAEKKDLILDRSNALVNAALVTCQGEVCQATIKQYWQGRLA